MPGSTPGLRDAAELSSGCSLESPRRFYRRSCAGSCFLSTGKPQAWSVVRALEGLPRPGGLWHLRQFIDVRCPNRLSEK